MLRRLHDRHQSSYVQRNRRTTNSVESVHVQCYNTLLSATVDKIVWNMNQLQMFCISSFAHRYSVSIIVIFTRRACSPTLSVDVYAAVCSAKYAAVFRTVSAPWLRHDDILTRSLFCDQTVTSIVITSWPMIIELWKGPQPAVCP